MALPPHSRLAPRQAERVAGGDRPAQKMKCAARDSYELCRRVNRIRVVLTMERLDDE